MIRRNILGVLGGAIAAGPSAAHAALESMAPTLLAPRALAEAAYASTAAVPAPPSGLWALPEGPLRSLIQAAYNRANQQRELEGEIQHRLASGFDPDIAANQSWSPSYKAHLQAERIRAKRDIDFALRERLWGH